MTQAPRRSEAKRQEEEEEEAQLRRRAGAAIGAAVRAGAQAYDRQRDLPRLIRAFPDAARAESVADLEAIVARLSRALRAERNRARSGHWTYDLNRHIALRQAHRAETERLAQMQAGRGARVP